MAQGNVNIAVNRRNSPCVLSPNCQLLFLTSLMSHPFDDAFYNGEYMPILCRVPNGVKAIRTANALTRINTFEFHTRNGTVGRLWTLNTMENTRRRLFNMFADVRHGGLDEDTCRCIERIMEASEAIRVGDIGNQDNQRVANMAR